MRELFASLLFGWVAQSRESGQINGCLGCSNTGTTEPGLQALFSFFSRSALVALIVTSPLFALTEPSGQDSSTLLADTAINSDTIHKNRISLSDIGGSLYGTRYGEDTFPWIRLYLAGSIDNLAGTEQQLTIHGSLFRVRHLGFRWKIPLANQWYFATGALAGSHPSIFDDWRAEQHIAGRIETGRMLSDHQNITLECIPHYWNYDLFDIDSKFQFEELTTTITWKADLRDRPFNPRSGYFISQSLSGNPLSSYREPGTNRSIRSLGGTTDIRGVISPTHGPISLAAQFKADLIYRGELNRFDRRYMGGNETVRGFGSGTFGRDQIYYNRVTLATECRFPIAKVKGINLSFLSWYDPSMKRLPFDITGTAFINAGHLWDTIESAFDLNAPHHSAAGAGMGIRILFPTLEMSASGDLGWPIYAPDSLKTTTPALHGYLNFPF